MTVSRFLRLLSSLLVMNLSIISGQRSECPMAKASAESSAHQAHAATNHLEHSAKATTENAVSDSPELCDMGCPPAACAAGSHCSSAAYGSSSLRQQVVVSRSTASSDDAKSTPYVIHPPEPPPPRG